MGGLDRTAADDDMLCRCGVLDAIRAGPALQCDAIITNMDEAVLHQDIGRTFDVYAIGVRSISRILYGKSTQSDMVREERVDRPEGAVLDLHPLDCDVL